MYINQLRIGYQTYSKNGMVEDTVTLRSRRWPVPRSNSHRPGAMGLKAVAAAKAASAAAKQAAAQAAMGDGGSALKVGKWKPVVFFFCENYWDVVFLLGWLLRGSSKGFVSWSMAGPFLLGTLSRLAPAPGHCNGSEHQFGGPAGRTSSGAQVWTAQLSIWIVLEISRYPCYPP